MDKETFEKVQNEYYDVVRRMRQEIAYCEKSLAERNVIDRCNTAVIGTADGRFWYQLKAGQNGKPELTIGLHAYSRISFVTKETARDIVNNKYGTWRNGNDQLIKLEAVSIPQFYRKCLEVNKRELKTYCRLFLFRSQYFDYLKFKEAWEETKIGG